MTVKTKKQPKTKPEVTQLTSDQKQAVTNAVKYSRKSVGTIAKEMNLPKVRVQEVYNAWLWPNGVPAIVKKHGGK